jgi:hypothetical protein
MKEINVLIGVRELPKAQSAAHDEFDGRRTPLIRDP